MATFARVGRKALGGQMQQALRQKLDLPRDNYFTIRNRNHADKFQFRTGGDKEAPHLWFMSTKNAGTGGANKILPTEAIKGPADPIRRGFPTSLTSMSDPVYDYMSQNYERPPVRGRPGTVIGGASQVPRAGYQHSLMDPSVDDFFQIPYERPGRRR